jgi:hypothetical protein
MKDVTVNKMELLEKLQANRSAHRGLLRRLGLGIRERFFLSWRRH